ncbi:excinuclease ABC subunit C [Pontibacter sp. HSC-14F20]|uniref:excinuclease ABC subunit C n=1 Tax=Pontibacter sp. HSC-14F20 TaxID=2864136 RepID=UPI001C72CC78|nr:excinuclease ABC subunit C [Pontibacter sp. HSC-14F20]MBX0334693.1 excinuclease ABC subunit C [Pontibacter sp. HSC-14F20]
MQPNQQANHFYVYIMGNQSQPQLSIGVSENLLQQMAGEGGQPGQTKLVYYEHYDLEEIARVREHRIKSAGPEDHLRLVESMNPNWLDLTDTLS